MISEYLTFVDILITLLWLGILAIIVNNQASKLENQELKPFYLRNFYFKVFYGITFTLVYLVVYDGGDTKAYWDGAVCLNKLFFQSPSLYLDAISSLPSDENRLIHFKS